MITFRIPLFLQEGHDDRVNDILGITNVASIRDKLRNVQSPLTAASPGKFPVEVKPVEAKGGVGVFATRNIQKGEICCFYDGLLCANQWMACMVAGRNGYNAALTAQSNGPIIAGFQRQWREGGCAQLCNDASTAYSDTDPSYLKDINVVERLSSHLSLVLVAKKRIKKGHELLLSYGAHYWKVKRASKEYYEYDSTSSEFRDFARQKVDSLDLGSDKASELVEIFCAEYEAHGNGMEGYVARLMVLMSIYIMIEGSLSQASPSIIAQAFEKK